MIDWKFNYYAKKQKEVLSLSEDEIWKYNENQYDIFWTPQEFNGLGLRKKEDLKAIRCICADFDKVDKETFIDRFEFLPYPTMIVETRSGFHMYWQLKEYLSPSEDNQNLYKQFIETRLIPIGADPQAKDVCRILRVPMSRYWWDSKNNFYGEQNIYCKIIHQSELCFTIKQLFNYFPTHVKKEDPVIQYVKSAKNIFKKEASNDFWDRCNEIDPCTALSILSGKSEVNYETFGFKLQSGVKRIYCNGKPSNAWIDKNNLIGSTVGAGPTIVNWLSYYGHSNSEIRKILLNYFPELEKK